MTPIEFLHFEDKLEKENAELKARMAEKERDREQWRELEEKILGAEQRAELSEKACAEMREALRIAVDLETDPWTAKRERDMIFESILFRWQQALSSSAGRDYVHKSEVKRNGDDFADLEDELMRTRSRLEVSQRSCEAWQEKAMQAAEEERYRCAATARTWAVGRDCRCLNIADSIAEEIRARGKK
jgi:hypothetical protein